MKTVFSPRHAGHSGNTELNSGAIVPAFELPRRAEIIRARVEEVGLGHGGGSFRCWPGDPCGVGFRLSLRAAIEHNIRIGSGGHQHRHFVALRQFAEG